LEKDGCKLTMCDVTLCLQGLWIISYGFASTLINQVLYDEGNGEFNIIAEYINCHRYNDKQNIKDKRVISKL